MAWRTWSREVDTWAQHRFAVDIAPLYTRWHQTARRAFRQEGLAGLQRTLTHTTPPLTDHLTTWLESLVRDTTTAWAQTWTQQVQRRYGAPAGPLRAAGEAAPGMRVNVRSIPPVTLGIAEDVAERLRNLPDAWGFTYSQRLWNQTQAAQRAVQDRLRVLLDTSQDFQESARDLRQFQRDDVRLPRHLQRLETLGRQMLQRVPGAQDAWKKALAEAKETVAQRAEGPLATRGFQRTTLQRLTKAVKEGSEAAFDEALGYFLDKRAQYRALVVVRSTVNRAAQETALRTYQQVDYVQAVKWRLNPGRSHHDECDLKARADIGLGPGVYFKSNVPWPDHPNGRCFLDAVFFTEDELRELHPPGPEDPQAYAAILQQLTGDAAKQANRLGRQRQTPAITEAFDRLVQQIPTVRPVYGRKSLTPPPPVPPVPPPAPVAPVPPAPLALTERIRQHLDAIPPAQRTEATYREVGALVLEEMEQRQLGSALQMAEHRQLGDRIATLERQLERTPPHEPSVVQMLDDLVASRRASEAAVPAIQQTMREDLHTVLAGVRPLGDQWTFAASSPREPVTRLQRALADIPTAWGEAVRPERVYVTAVPRGFYLHDPDVPTIGLSKEGVAVAYHELGHRFEHYANLRALEAEFHARRTAGEARENIAPWAPRPELGRPDRYITPYVGREYPDGRAYEIFSVGLESVFTGRYALWLDQEHYTFILGLLAAL